MISSINFIPYICIQMDTRQIVDEHFTNSYRYYKQVCYQYYKGRYPYEDLLNEAYLKFTEVSEETIRRLHAVNKLHCVVLRIIRFLYRDRFVSANRMKNGVVNNSSPLFETPGVSYASEMIADTTDTILDFTEQEVRDYFEKATRIMEEALQQPVIQRKERTDYQKVQTVIAVLQSNINQISKQTGISRPFITESYNQGKQFLKEQILK